MGWGVEKSHWHGRACSSHLVQAPGGLMQALEHANVFVFVRQRGRSGHGA